MLDSEHRPVLTEREILKNLQAIIADADTTPPNAVAKSAVGVLTTENRKIWSNLRKILQSTKHNAACLQVVDDALFVVCLDDDDGVANDTAELCKNFLCGTYALTNGVQTGTCTNRWYDKVCCFSSLVLSCGGMGFLLFGFCLVANHHMLKWNCRNQL